MFKFFSLFILFLFFANSLEAQQIEKNSAHYFVPLIFNSWYPSILIDVNGVKIPLQLDIGAATLDLTLNPNLIKKFAIKIDYTGNKKQLSDTQGRRAIVREFILPKVKMENLTIHNVKGFETHPFPWGTPGPAPKGIENGVIGMGILNKFDSVIIDYKNKKLILINGPRLPRGYKINFSTKQPFELKGNIFTSVQNGNKKLNLLWDTGAPINLIKPDLGVGKIKKCSAKALSELNLNPSECKGIMADLIISGQTFKNTFYVYPMKGLPADGVLGEPFFKNHIIYINFKERFMVVN